jgi:hypothetical protein
MSLSDIAEAVDADQRLLTVGPLRNDRPSTAFGMPVDFTSISEALDSIPTLVPDDPNHSFVDRWTIVVMSGFYREVIRCKPYVNIVGINKESVYIQAPADRARDRNDPRLGDVYLSSLSLVSNVTLLGQGGGMLGDVSVWGFDTYSNQRGAPSIPCRFSACSRTRTGAICTPNSSARCPAEASPTPSAL